jgi:hypothetical protein
MRHVLQLSHRSFACSHEFVLVAFDVLNSSHGQIPAAIRTKANREAILLVTEAELIQALKLKIRAANGDSVDMSSLSDNVRAFLSTLSTGRALMHGTVEEGQREKTKLTSMCRHLGSASIWTTFSPNDARILTALLYAGYPEAEAQAMDAQARTLAMARDPVAAAAFFHNTVKKAFKHVFGWDWELGRTPDGQCGAMGRLEAFFAAIEEQYRGARSRLPPLLVFVLHLFSNRSCCCCHVSCSAVHDNV